MQSQHGSHSLLVHVASLLRALSLSLLAVTSLSLVVTALVWPYEADRLLDRNDVVVLQAVLDPGNEQVLLFSRTIPKYSPAGGDYRVTLRGLGDGGPPNTSWQAASLCHAPGGAILGEWDGTIRRLLSPWRTGQSHVIGRQSDGAPIKLSCSADGRRLLSLGEKHLYLWDLHSGRLIQQLPRGEIGDVVLSADAERFYHACDKQLLERDVINGEIMRAMPLCCEPLEMACSADGLHLAMLGCDGSVNMLRIATGEWLWQRPIDQPTLVAATLAFCPRGLSIATAHQSDRRSNQWTVEVRQVHSGQHEAAFDVAERVFGVAISADQTVESWGANGSFRQWRRAERLPTDAGQQFTAQGNPQLKIAIE